MLLQLPSLRFFFFSMAHPKGTPEPVPTLEDFLKSAKGKCRLMIELKATGHEDHIEEQVLSLVQKYGMERQLRLWI